MSDTKGKVNLLDTVPVQCGHITTEWEGEYAILSFPRFKYDWMRRFLLPKSMSADIHVKLEEHGTAVWRLIDGNRTVQEITSRLPTISKMKITILLVSLLTLCSCKKMDSFS